MKEKTVKMDWIWLNHELQPILSALETSNRVAPKNKELSQELVNSAIQKLRTISLKLAEISRTERLKKPNLKFRKLTYEGLNIRK